jgi:hypothetical protein
VNRALQKPTWRSTQRAIVAPRILGRPKLSSLYDFLMAASATLKWGQMLITLSREIVPGNAIFVSKRH